LTDQSVKSWRFKL